MLLWFAAIAAAVAAPVDRIAAVVNEDVIAWSEIYEIGSDFIVPRASDPSSRRSAELEVLESLIMRRLVAQEIERLGMSITEEELERTIADVAASNGLDKAGLRREVERSGLGWEQYRQELRESMRQMRFNQAVLQPRITVDEDALLDAYRRAGESTPEEVELGAIFFSGSSSFLSPEEVSQEQGITVEEAQAMLDAAIEKQELSMQESRRQAADRLAGGEAFSSIAASLDQGGFGARGGSMGVFPQGQLRPELDVAAFSTEVGKLSDLICDDTGCYLLYVFDRRRTALPPFEAIREQLLDSYFGERFDRELDIWFEQARRRATVEIRLPENP